MTFIQETSLGSSFLQKETTPADRSLVNLVQFYEVQSGSDGASSNTVFTLSKAYVIGSYTLLVFVNGQLSEKVSSASDTTEHEETDSYTVTFGASLQDADVVEFYIVGSYKIGQSDFDTMMSSYQTSVGGLAGFKNKIINGDFNMWQRGTSFAAVASGAYTVDRIKYSKSGTMVHTISRDTDVPTQSQSERKSNYSMKVDCTTADVAIAATDYTVLSQKIEGYNFAPLVGKTCTLSFWVKATKTGIYCVSFANSGGDRNYIVEYTILTSNTWEKKEITLTFDYSGGTWDYINGIGLSVYWWLACGSNYHSTADSWLEASNKFTTSNQVNACDNVANNFWLSQVQFEVGSVITPLEGRSIGQEMALCQRYYEEGYNKVRGKEYSDTSGFTTSIGFRNTKRAAPTVTFYNTADGGSNSSVTTEGVHTFSFGIKAFSTGAPAASVYIQTNWKADAEL